MAAAEPVYSPTTVSETISKKWLIVPTDNLDKVRCLIKVVEVVSNILIIVIVMILLLLMFHCAGQVLIQA